MIEALREAIKLEWKGSFSHEADDLKIDWLESISYSKLSDELLKKAEKNTKKERLKDYSRYNMRIGLENKWNEQTSYAVGEYLFVLFESVEPDNLDA